MSANEKYDVLVVFKLNDTIIGRNVVNYYLKASDTSQSFVDDITLPNPLNNISPMHVYFKLPTPTQRNNQVVKEIKHNGRVTRTSRPVKTTQFRFVYLKALCFRCHLCSCYCCYFTLERFHIGSCVFFCEYFMCKHISFPINVLHSSL